jgi:hypothetical protein
MDARMVQWGYEILQAAATLMREYGVEKKTKATQNQTRTTLPMSVLGV